MPRRSSAEKLPPLPALEPVRFSKLKLMNKSAAHYQAGFGEETGPMRKGSALHAYLLGGPEKVVVYQGGRRDERIAAWREFQAEHAGKHILIPSEHELVRGMRESVERNRDAMTLLDDGVQECRIRWQIAGRDCEGTPDVAKPKKNGKKRLVELKSTDTSKPDLFFMKARKLAYHAQIDWYANGLERSQNYAPGPVDEVYVIAVESTPPYPVTVIEVDPGVLAHGRRLWRLWWEQLMNCEAAQHFPPYVQSRVTWHWQDESDDGLDWGEDETITNDNGEE